MLSNRNVERVDAYDICSEFADSVSGDVNFGGRFDKILIDDPVSIEYSWSINVKHDHAKS